MKAEKRYIEELYYLKNGWIDDKEYYIFRNSEGEFRAVEAKLIEIPQLEPNSKIKALVKHTGCSGRVIDQVYV